MNITSISFHKKLGLHVILNESYSKQKGKYVVCVNSFSFENRQITDIGISCLPALDKHTKL